MAYILRVSLVVPICLNLQWRPRSIHSPEQSITIPTRNPNVSSHFNDKHHSKRKETLLITFSMM